MSPLCVSGAAILSLEWAHEACANSFGEGWRWLSHAEQGGWGATGAWLDDIGVGERGWIYVADQDSECFSSPPLDTGDGKTIAHGVTWLRAPGACTAACQPGDGLEGPEYYPHVGACNPYDGDTPCDACRRLICVR